MLILSRHAGEGVLIGDGIVVRIKKVRGSTVQFAIEAPQDVRIRRGDPAPHETSLHPLRVALSLLPKPSLQFRGTIS